LTLEAPPALFLYALAGVVLAVHVATADLAASETVPVAVWALGNPEEFNGSGQ